MAHYVYLGSHVERRRLWYGKRYFRSEEQRVIDRSRYPIGTLADCSPFGHYPVMKKNNTVLSLLSLYSITVIHSLTINLRVIQCTA